MVSLVLPGAQRYLHCLRNYQSPAQEDMEAWSQFYLLCDPLLRRFARSCQVRPCDVDDCVQSSWKQITAALTAFRDDGQSARLAGWLHVIVRSRATDLRRYGARHPTRRLTARLEARQSSRDMDPAAERERSQERRRVREALEQLYRRASQVNSRMFQMRWMEERTVRDVARALDLTPEQVRYRCFRMKQKFRLLYEKEFNQKLR
ncbi:MAG TPA: sigma-70 family RNA polymerase sigma factor [Gemmataceae bacterium]|nr:sigma-70 family RNA polymerase sigma factor [Gemmataceae bacterium]